MAYILHHHPICPFSRKIRFLLREKDIEFKEKEVNYSSDSAFAKLNPAKQTPILEDDEAKVFICDSSVIVEFIEENHKDVSKINFLGNGKFERAEVRRLQRWFDDKFFREIAYGILNEKIVKTLKKANSVIDTQPIKEAKSHVKFHLDYIEKLLSTRKYLASDNISIADIAAACQISSLDYLDDIDWSRRNFLQDWYRLIKSRIGFRDILQDYVPGFRPPSHYRDLDF